MVRALPCHGRGRGFEPRRFRQLTIFAALAKMSKHRNRNRNYYSGSATSNDPSNTLHHTYALKNSEAIPVYKDSSVSFSKETEVGMEQLEEDGSQEVINEEPLPVQNSQVPPQQELPFDYRENSLTNMLATVAALLFVLGLSYFAYKSFVAGKIAFFGDKPERNQITSKAAFTVREDENIIDEQEMNSPARDEQQYTPPADTQAFIEPLGNFTNTPEQNEQLQKATATRGQQWVPNDYKPGDVKPENKKYTVKSGDTLWEIAEGVYGDGSLWVNILSANASNVGYLANGQQALIFPGQSLVIP